MDTEYLPITEDGGVLKKILKEGNGDLPQNSNECHVFLYLIFRCITQAN